jgi:hypothetical protein
METILTCESISHHMLYEQYEFLSPECVCLGWMSYLNKSSHSLMPEYYLCWQKSI